MDQFIKLTSDNLKKEHICCAISDKKHQAGVECKKAWIEKQLGGGHTFYKLNQNGKVFIEYTDAENAWAPIVAPGFLYIHCLWVSGSFKDKGYGKQLLQYAIDDAKQRGKSGLCIIASAKKFPFLADKKYLLSHGFKTTDKINEYELMGLIFDDKNEPRFRDSARLNKNGKQGYTVYYSPQCPYILNCIKEIKEVAGVRGVLIETVAVTSKEQAQAMPCVFNNFVIFKDGVFLTHHLLNAGLFEKEITK